MAVQVLIVGAGPVGMTLPLELAGDGVPVRMVDRSSQGTDKFKALVLWRRSLDLFDRTGRSPAFVAALQGLAPTRRGPGDG